MYMYIFFIFYQVVGKFVSLFMGFGLAGVLEAERGEDFYVFLTS